MSWEDSWSRTACLPCSGDVHDRLPSPALLNRMIQIAYLVSAVLFILGLKGMSHPRTAVRGNYLGVLGMLVAVGATILFHGGEPFRYGPVIFGSIVGTAIGVLLAVRIEMTAMPQMVALLNGFGGAASTLVAGAELLHLSDPATDVLIAVGASGIIGTVTFWGSMVAFAKLQELSWFPADWRMPRQQLVNGALALFLVVLTAILAKSGLIWIYLPVVLISSVLGVLLVISIGGADMPVVIALLNSYSGLAAAATGFVIDNYVLIIAGTLVGASGVILTQIMCRAMNRSLTNVLFGVMEGGTGSQNAETVYQSVRSTSAEDVAVILATAQRVVFVPGYGMAVAQAQHVVRDLGNLLESRGVTVEYAIHPVAGRMPGHMNVLLAEADVSYDKLLEMDQINPTLDTVDVAIVIGANDVVNPLAKTDPQSPIAGMPIIEVDRCRAVVIVKRSLSPGFAKIPNPLFAAPNALMLFADAKQGVLDIVKAMG